MPSSGASTRGSALERTRGAGWWFGDPWREVMFGGSSAPEGARRSALVRRLTLALLALSAAALLMVALVFPPDIVAVVLPTLGLAMSLYGVAHVLARRNRFLAAAGITVFLQVAVPPAIVSGLSADALAPMSTAAWSAIGILTAAATLGPGSVLATGTACAITVTLGLGIASKFEVSLPEPMFLVLTVTVMVYAYTRHRNALEIVRRGHLEARNRELEELRATLEQRVVERTLELTKTTERLASANEAQRAQQELLVRTEKMAAVGRLTAGFAHEMASPLQAVAGALVDLDGLRREYADSNDDPDVTPADHEEIAKEMAEALALARSGVQRCTRFVNSLRAHTRDPGPMAVERFDAAHVTDQAVDLVRHVARQVGVRLMVQSSGQPVMLAGVPSRFHQVVTNLLSNAIDAIADTGREGTVVVQCVRGGDDAVLRVTDDGPGIAPELVERIFEPMFTTKSYGKGTGLGLSIVRDIVRDELKGSVRVETKSERGTSFVVRCPAVDGETDGT